jgi:hypothetical protein
MMLTQMMKISEMVELVSFHRSEQWLHDVVEIEYSLKKEDSQEVFKLFEELKDKEDFEEK